MCDIRFFFIKISILSRLLTLFPMSLKYNQPEKSEQKLLILTGIYVFCILLAEIFGIKTIPLGIGNIDL
jgi:hypothetical protein